MEKKDQTKCCLQEMQFKYKDTNRLKGQKRYTVLTLIKRKQKWLEY